MKDKLTTALKILISVSLMAYLLYRFLSNPTDRELFITALTSADYAYLLLAVLLFVLAIFSNAVKWYILLRAQGVPVPLKSLTAYTFVGFFFNNFLPANVGGDVMRGYGVARYTDRTTDAAVSVVVDRIIGLMAFMSTAVVAAFTAVYLVSQGTAGIVPADHTLVQNLTQVEWLAFIGIAMIVLVFAVMLSQRLRGLIGKLFEIRFLSPLSPLYRQISNAFGAYRYAYQSLLGAFVMGVVTVLLTGLIDLCIVAALGGNILPIYIFLFNPIIAVLLIIPISIGGLGTGSVLYVYFYGLVGISQPLAFALSLVKQAVVYLGSLPGGVLWLQRERTPADSSSVMPLK